MYRRTTGELSIAGSYFINVISPFGVGSPMSTYVRYKHEPNGQPTLQIQIPIPKDMVVIKDPPAMWRLGRFLSVMSEANEVVRVARILTDNGELTRPVVKLVLLPTE